MCLQRDFTGLMGARKEFLKYQISVDTTPAFEAPAPDLTGLKDLLYTECGDASRGEFRSLVSRLEKAIGVNEKVFVSVAGSEIPLQSSVNIPIRVQESHASAPEAPISASQEVVQTTRPFSLFAVLRSLLNYK
jgi:hypothetical protein